MISFGLRGVRPSVNMVLTPRVHHPPDTERLLMQNESAPTAREYINRAAQVGEAPVAQALALLAIATSLDELVQLHKSR